MPTPKFDGPLRWRTFRKQLLSLREDTLTGQKLAGRNITRSVYPGKGTVLNANRKPGRDTTDTIGACCAPDGSCSITTEADCAASGGTYKGDGTPCDPNPCCSEITLSCDSISASKTHPAPVSVTFDGITFPGCCQTGSFKLIACTSDPPGALCIPLNDTFVFNASGGSCSGSFLQKQCYLTSNTIDAILSYTGDDCTEDESYEDGTAFNILFGFSDGSGVVPSGWFIFASSAFGTYFGAWGLAITDLCAPIANMLTCGFSPFSGFAPAGASGGTATLNTPDTDNACEEAVDLLPDYPGTFAGSCSASRDSNNPDDCFFASCTISRFKPKFSIPVALDHDIVICYNEHFAPDDGDPVDTPRTVTIPAGETEIEGDEVTEPDEDGEITITDITNSCDNPDECIAA